jgi:hypothetical protein
MYQFKKQEDEIAYQRIFYVNSWKFVRLVSVMFGFVSLFFICVFGTQANALSKNEAVWLTPSASDEIDTIDQEE